MNDKNRWRKSLAAFFLIWTFLTGGLPIAAQDLAPTEDISLGSSVFVFRGSGKSSLKKFASRITSKPKRTKTERIAYTKKIRKQYDTLAKVIKRRERVKPVSEESLASISRKSPKEASLVFTGAGLFYYDKNETDKSIGFFREAVKLDQKNADAKLGLSDALARRGAEFLENDQKEEAKKFYEEAVKFNDKNSVAFIGLGEVYDTLEENDATIASAVKNYEKALAIDKELTEIYAPLGILYFQQNQTAKAEQFLTKALLTNKDDAATFYFLGLIRFNQTRYDEAQAAFNQAIKLNPKLAESHYQLGKTYEKLNRDKEAINEYKEAIRLNSRYDEAWFDLGAAYYNQENYQEAASAYTQVTKLENTNGEAHANLGDAYRQLGRFGEAEGSYRLATLFIKNDAELFSKFGYVLGKQFKWNGAIDALNKAIAIKADHVDYTNLGWTYYNAAQVELRAKRAAEGKAKLHLAKNALQKAVETNQTFAPAYLNLGITLTDLGEYQASVEALKRAVSLRKNWIFAINELGLAYRKLNDFENAVKQFQKVVEIDPEFNIGYYNLSESEFRRGNMKEARKAQDKLKKLNKNQAFNKNLVKSLEIMFLNAGKK